MGVKEQNRTEHRLKTDIWLSWTQQIRLCCCKRTHCAPSNIFSPTLRRLYYFKPIWQASSVIMALVHLSAEKQMTSWKLSCCTEITNQDHAVSRINRLPTKEIIKVVRVWKEINYVFAINPFVNNAFTITCGCHAQLQERTRRWSGKMDLII